MAPTFRQLRYFTVLSEELHFGRSAKRLNISQPPLSTSIRQLELDIGVVLLDRTSRQVALTAAGKMFAERARRLLNELEESTGLARAVAASPGGVIRVGFIPSAVFIGLIDATTEFSRSNPGYTVELREMNSATQIHTLLEKRIELGLVHHVGADINDDMRVQLVAHQPFVCCVPVEHPFARRSAISLAEFERQTVIMFARDRAPSFHDHIISLFARANVTPPIAHHIGNWLTILSLVGFGMGISLVPSSLAKVNIGRAVFVPLKERWAECDVHCVWSASEIHEGRDHFISSLISCMGNHRTSAT